MMVPTMLQSIKSPQSPTVRRIVLPWESLEEDESVKTLDWEANPLVRKLRFWHQEHKKSSWKVRRDSILSSGVFHEHYSEGLMSVGEKFFAPNGVLQRMVDEVFGAPSILTGVLMTVPKEEATITLSKNQVFVILSLCAFNFFENYRFNSMFASESMTSCLINYYCRYVADTKKDSTYSTTWVSVERRVLQQKVDWANSTHLFPPLKFVVKKTGIEDFRESYQVNFADRYPGGTLPSPQPDIVQEEILFMVYPELFVVPILVPPIEAEESIVVRGLTRVNKYKGYQTSFRYDGNFTSDKQLNSIIFMDARHGGIRDEPSLLRDLNKAYVGFSCETYGKAIATGHWGCGAFGGDKILKACVQLMAAGESDVPLDYANYGAVEILDFPSFHKGLLAEGVTVGELYKCVLALLENDYSGSIDKNGKRLKKELVPSLTDIFEVILAKRLLLRRGMSVDSAKEKAREARRQNPGGSQNSRSHSQSGRRDIADRVVRRSMSSGNLARASRGAGKEPVEKQAQG
eukprot:TRINITY_DN640_c4_g1_i2.p1 TRINITY_DN640_c4_g1~~TRINITY_DN640_c4_g1_i2.p1  ORF type:complete len:517 (-),score=93.29 TRINITY_DN640_c4_g1_i2:76-1626(-)